MSDLNSAVLPSARHEIELQSLLHILDICLRFLELKHHCHHYNHRD